ncbi:methyltransferase domain-containing protein [Streptomyces sp. SP17BM10]|uniref:methyltransferase domain-containing protein n=1 Tax=Streptomyces sp. SP17BM10 TaxID=3002530 RepID=UPI002E7A8738|nr:methyltransferase domain-containing protein [Streptomyces sp. SP17BM10]MEE1782951.1 methyltransferase domain-containing protein [Streptomyces sp. SP17BM10]
MTGLPDSAHVVIVNRWSRTDFADYARYLDHRAHRVGYVTSAAGRAAVPADAAEVVQVADLDDLAEVRTAVAALARRHGAPDRIVAMQELDLLTGAALREEWGCPGPRTDQVVPFRDKYAMAGRVSGAGLAVPRFERVTDAASVRAFAASTGWPVVLKPLAGRGASGVLLLTGAADLDAAAPASDGSFQEPYLVQQFNPHPTYHVDGLFTGERLADHRVSRYVNNCLAFRADGIPLGSVEEDDSRLLRSIREFATRVLAALTDRPTVFHLELFVDRATGDCAFLEVAARAGGAEIPVLWRESGRGDLLETLARTQLDLPVDQTSASGEDGEVGGWLIVPAPRLRPCRITGSSSMLGREGGPYAETFLPVGRVLPRTDPYHQHVGGRFRFRGPSSDAVEAGIRATAADFRMTVEPEGPRTPRGTGPGTIAPDGSAVEFFATLPPGTGTAAAVHGAIPERASVLELGAGAGRVTHPLAALGHPVVAVDESAEMLARLTGGAPATTEVETVLSRIEDLRLDRTFDAVVLLSSLINYVSRKPLLDACRRHLAPHGAVIVQRTDPAFFEKVGPAEWENRGTRFRNYDVEELDDGIVACTKEYRVGDRTWTFSGVFHRLGDDELPDVLGASGLRFDRFLDERRTYILARAA